YARSNFRAVLVVAAATACLVTVGSAPGQAGGAQRIATHGSAYGFALGCGSLVGSCFFGGSFFSLLVGCGFLRCCFFCGGFFLGSRFFSGFFLGLLLCGCFLGCRF